MVQSAAGNQVPSIRDQRLYNCQRRVSARLTAEGALPLGLMAKGKLEMLLAALTSVLLLGTVQAWTLTGSSELSVHPPSSESIDPGVVLYGKGKFLPFFLCVCKCSTLW